MPLLARSFTRSPHGLATTSRRFQCCTRKAQELAKLTWLLPKPAKDEKDKEKKIPGTKGPGSSDRFVRAAELTRDGKLAAAGDSEGNVRLWDISGLWQNHQAPKQPSLILKGPKLNGANKEVQSLAFSPDGRTLAVYHQGGSVRIWKVATGDLIASLKGEAFMTPGVRNRFPPMAFSPDSRLLAMVGTRCKLWDVLTQKEVASLFVSEGAADGAAVAWGRGAFAVDAKGKLVVSEGPAGVTTAAFSRDGKGLAVGFTDAVVQLFDLTSMWEDLKSPPTAAVALKVTERKKKDKKRLPGEMEAPQSPLLLHVRCTAFSPDGRSVAAVTGDGTVKIFAVAPKRDKRKDLGRLQGAWKVVEMELGGQKVPTKAIELMALTFAPQNLTVEGRVLEYSGIGGVVTAATEEMRFEINPAEEPKTLDVSLDDGTKLPGIYDLQDDGLRLCIDFSGAERPRDFSTKRGQMANMVLRRNRD
jgi:uncharacterized protein (TIGR03067 family)